MPVPNDGLACCVRRQVLRLFLLQRKLATLSPLFLALLKFWSERVVRLLHSRSAPTVRQTPDQATLRLFRFAVTMALVINRGACSIYAKKIPTPKVKVANRARRETVPTTRSADFQPQAALRDDCGGIESRDTTCALI